MNIAGTSENYGTEQEHLNNVFGARLRITSLRAAGEGPGVEFLEYLAPRDGGPAPSDERANDLFHWQTTLIVPDIGKSAQSLLSADFRLISPGAVAVNDGRLGFAKRSASPRPGWPHDGIDPEMTALQVTQTAHANFQPMGR